MKWTAVRLMVRGPQFIVTNNILLNLFRLTVEWAGRGRRSGGGRDRERGRGDSGRGDSGRDRRRAGQRPDHSDYRIRIEGLPLSIHWQDLKVPTNYVVHPH